MELGPSPLGTSYLALHIPALPLEALLRHQPEKRRHPHALLSPSAHSSTVIHANRAARRRAVHDGLSHTRALARCPELKFLERAPEAETAVLHDLLQCAESLTPDFELTTPDTLILAGLRIKQEIPSEIRNLKSEIEPLGLPLHLAAAATPDLAHLFSLHPATSHSLIYRGADYRWKKPTHLHDSLTALPLQILHHLELGTFHLELPSQWGLQTLADLARLPRQDLAERLGPDFVRLHDILHGRHQRLLRIFRPAESIEAHTDLEHPLSHGDGLVLWLRRTLHTLCSRLASSYRAAAEIHLTLDLEDQPPHRHTHRLPEPSASPETLLRPLATHLEHLTLTAPVTGFHLRLTPCAGHAGQHELFDRGIRQPHRLADTLIRLAALLGDDRLGFPSPGFTHRPDTFALHPAHHLFDQTSLPSPRREAAHSLWHLELRTSNFGPPLSRFRPPIEVSVAFENASGHPVPLALLTGPHRGRVTHRHGPFPLSGQWWDPGEKWQQVEWDIRLETRHLLRLAHIPPDLWQLQGAYP
ncbi:hypothetical protein [Haloferula sp. A504]|uniref:Y-family DNA polymerase n=1 Tax=Haloferula sp. A504 TaxID=3373601 RepID=UPI0031C86626|nr:DNA polymerase Y family protein [Verrucomicrobiaceae bacterium E54]